MARRLSERDLERGLLAHLSSSWGWALLSLGARFRSKSEAKSLGIDLLFYHLKLRSFVVIDLKRNSFKPEYAGKMNFYLSAVDDMLRHPDDKPGIGLILCKGKEGVVAEYALRDINKPLGISEFRHLEKLPDQLKGTLPTIEEIEAELAKSKDTTPE